MNKAGWKKLPEAVRYEAILKAAACCFLEKGYHGASMQDVAKAAGLTKGGLYHHFSGKEAIRDVLIAQFLDLDRLGLASLAQLSVPADEKLLRAGDLLLSGLATKEGSAPRFVADAVACSGEVEAVTNFYDEIERLLVGWFEEAQEAGSISSKTDAKTLAELYTALLDGVQIRKDITGIQPAENPLTNFINILR